MVLSSLYYRIQISTEQLVPRLGMAYYSNVYLILCPVPLCVILFLTLYYFAAACYSQFLNLVAGGGVTVSVVLRFSPRHMLGLCFSEV